MSLFFIFRDTTSSWQPCISVWRSVFVKNAAGCFLAVNGVKLLGVHFSQALWNVLLKGGWFSHFVLFPFNALVIDGGSGCSHEQTTSRCWTTSWPRSQTNGEKSFKKDRQFSNYLCHSTQNLSKPNPERGSNNQLRTKPQFRPGTFGVHFKVYSWPWIYILPTNLGSTFGIWVTIGFLLFPGLVGGNFLRPSLWKSLLQNSKIFHAVIKISKWVGNNDKVAAEEVTNLAVIWQ